MAIRCANSRCSTTRRRQEGKLFRLDLELGSLAGEDEHKTEYLWLCPRCAQLMYPRVEVKGDTIRILLSKYTPSWTAAPNVLLHQAN
jgi:hypothetical protein